MGPVDPRLTALFRRRLVVHGVSRRDDHADRDGLLDYWRRVVGSSDRGASVILEVGALSITFPDGRSGGRVSAVEGLSFGVDEGETFAIIGESGSGKSVTAMSLVGLAPSTAVASG